MNKVEDLYYVLHLTLSKLPFEVMVTGEKKKEYRKGSKWIESRLINVNRINKRYDYIKFTNGYGKDKPYFICKYNGFEKVFSKQKPIKFSNGLIIDNIVNCDFIINCGEIIQTGNLKTVL